MLGQGERQRRRRDGDVLLARQREPEAGALTRRAPRRQPARVAAGAREGDGEPEAGAPGVAGPGGVGPPEAVEDERGLPRAQPDTLVGDDDGDGGVVAGDGHLDRATLAVL